MKNKHPLQIICEVLDLEIRSYSGRGMFGRSCLGIDLDRGASVGTIFAQIIEGLFDEGVSRASDFSKDGEDVDINDVALEIGRAFRNMSQDQMGMGTIVYFPGVPFVESDSEEDEEDTE